MRVGKIRKETQLRDFWKKGRQKIQNMESPNQKKRTNSNKTEQQKLTVTNYEWDKYTSFVEQEKVKTNNEPADRKLKRNHKDNQKTTDNSKGNNRGNSKTIKIKVKKELQEKSDLYFSDTIDVSKQNYKTEPRYIKYSSTNTKRISSSNSVTIKKSLIEDINILTNWIQKTRSLEKYRQHYKTSTFVTTSNYYSVLRNTHNNKVQRKVKKRIRKMAPKTGSTQKQAE
jgi:hypothetical protein